MTSVRRELTEGWTVTPTGLAAPAELIGRAIPAAVPGEVHLDLLRAGHIPDPFLDDHEALTAWVGREDWTYTATVHLTAQELEAHQRHDLVFEGIDTAARIRLNGTEIAEVANQHRTYRFDVAHLLSAGANELSVTLRSPVRHADEQSLALGPRPRPYPHPYEAVRKAACSFGWDWGIATFSLGLWKPVRLESWSTARISAARLRAEVDPSDQGTVTAEVEIEHAGATASPDLRLRLSLDGGDADDDAAPRRHCQGDCDARCRHSGPLVAIGLRRAAAPQR